MVQAFSSRWRQSQGLESQEGSTERPQKEDPNFAHLSVAQDRAATKAA